MINGRRKLISGLTLGGTITGLVYYLYSNKKLRGEISAKVIDTLTALSKNSYDVKDKLTNKVEDSLHTFSETTHRMQGELVNEIEDRFNTLLENSHEIQGRVTNLMNESKSSFNHILKDTKTGFSKSLDRKNQQFNDIVSRLTAIPVRRRVIFLSGLTIGSAVIGFGYYLYSNKKLTEQISDKEKEVSPEIYEKSINVVYDKKRSLNQVVYDTKSSLVKSLDKVIKEFTATLSRLTSAFKAGKGAAKEGLNNSKILHQDSEDIAESVKDTGINFDKTASGKAGNEAFHINKYSEN